MPSICDDFTEVCVQYFVLADCNRWLYCQLFFSGASEVGMMLDSVLFLLADGDDVIN